VENVGKEFSRICRRVESIIDLGLGFCKFWQLPETLLRVKFSQVVSVVFFQAVCSAFIGFAQHSVHPTGGTLRVFKQFACLEAGSVKMALPRPAHQRVTRAVSWLF
jgi:hypothetical protein